MFKIVLTAATLSVASLSVQASPTPTDLISPVSPAMLSIDIAAATPVVEEAAPVDQVAYYCEWATVYDYYGNWITVWQCY